MSPDRLLPPDVEREVPPASTPMPMASLSHLSQQTWMPIYWRMLKWFYIPRKDLKTYEGTIKHLYTPMRVQTWLTANCRYGFDLFDTWNPPDVFWKKRVGDCDEHALFSNACLKGKYVSYLLLMFRMDGDKQYGHISHIIREDGEWTSVGTFGLMRHGDKSIPEIIPDWNRYDTWHRYKLLDESLNLIEEVYRDA